MLSTRTRFTTKALGAALSAVLATTALAIGATAPSVAAAEDARAESPFIGTWKTIDDETGNAKSHVKIFKVGPYYVGQITELLRAEDRGKICEKCDDDDSRKGQPVLNMIILKNMKDDDGVLKGGTILDPKNGKTYRCKMWFDDDTNVLTVRGYVGPFFRTQKWYRL